MPQASTLRLADASESHHNAGSGVSHKRAPNPTIEDIITGAHTDDPLQARKDLQDLKDRAAYVYITGCFPTHLRSWFLSLLRIGTQVTPQRQSLDGMSGSIKVTPELVDRLHLEGHPMVRKVREYIRNGYRIVVQPGHFTERRPYGKIFMAKRIRGTIRGGTDRKVTIKVDGSIKDGWE